MQMVNATPVIKIVYIEKKYSVLNTNVKIVAKKIKIQN